MGRTSIHALPDGIDPPIAVECSFDARYGLEIVAEDVGAGGGVTARVPVRPKLLNARGVVHGGVFASIAEAIASRGTALAVVPEGRAAMGLSNDTTLVAPVSGGALHADAQVRARGEGEWVWAVETRDDTGRLCAFSRVTVAVR
jgi:1,4-dihydroxy-2-naphthoyl-CoA hydrolase